MVIILIILLLFLLRIMCVFMQGLHLSEDGHGIFNMHTNLDACCMKVKQALPSPHKCGFKRAKNKQTKTKTKQKPQSFSFTLLCQGVEP